MKGSYFIVKGEGCYHIVFDFMQTKYGEQFRSDIIDGAIFYVEDYSMMNSSELMTVLRIQKINGNNNECEIEIISGGGAKGWLSWTFGNETRRVNSAMKQLTSFCYENGYSYSEIVYKK